MNIRVMYEDNNSGQIDSSLLEDMISAHKIKRFMRSESWTDVGTGHIRGEGGEYEGVDRRGTYGLTSEMKYKIVA